MALLSLYNALKRMLALLLVGTVLTACSHADAPWKLTDVSGHLPDLSFNLTDDNGQPVTGHSFEGQTTLVYFGYTHCPDVCPETMARLMQVVQQLGPDAKDVRIVFITVDPARDTPAQLRAYLWSPSFPKGAIGLTGSAAEIKAVTAAYHVYFSRQGQGADYTVDHTSIIYLMDPKGRFVSPVTEGPPAVMAKQILAAMAGESQKCRTLGSLDFASQHSP